MIISLVRTEFARLTSSRIGLLALIALMVVPVVYGGLYLWGNQDPYSRLDQIPAAVVVNDEGATTDDGEAVNYGQDAADSLLEGMDFGWVEVSAAEAKSGIVDGTYDFGITFPKKFSANLVSAAGDDPTAATLELTTDDTNSYLSTTLAERAAEAVRVKVAAQLGREAATTLLDSLEQVREGLVDAADGSKQLADGAGSAATGAASLATGAATAADGAASLATGNASLSSGATKLSSGLTQLDDSAAALPAGTSSLASGAAAVASGATGVSQALTGLGAATANANKLATGTPAAVAAALAAAGVDATTSGAVLADLTAHLTALATATGTADGTAAAIAPKAAELAAGANQVSAGAATLNSQAPALAAAVHSAAAGASTLAGGAKTAASGASSLADGTAQLSAGATDLSTGLDTLSSGATELSTSLGDAVDKIPGSTDAEREKAAAAIADPVLVDKTAITEAQNYGAGLAPFFISLAAWIGMYALFLLVRPLSRRALTAVRRPVRTALAGWLTPALLGVVQVAALFALVTFGLGMESADPVALLGFLAFVSITFAAIILALNVWLGSVGQFIGLILMVVQLVTAGGTFPWQTLPAPLAFLHQLLPMTHAVDGIRQLMYGGSGAAFIGAFWPLAFWLVAGLGLSVLGALKQGRFRTLRELRPSPIGA